jgi:SAM-dependent methyltransferase
MGGVDAAVLQYLMAPAGRELLAAVDAAFDGTNALAVSARLRATYEPEQVAVALTQVELRRRAVEKFGSDASGMFFTRDGLEQATPRTVAAHRARRAQESGARQVLELGCGIGSDLLAFCRAGLQETAVDIDPLTVAVAAANVAVLGLGAVVRVGTAESEDRSGVDLVYLDPSRRGARGRVFDPASYSPPWTFVEAVLAEGPAVVKAAPGLPHDRIPVAVEAEWVSLDGGLRETALWSGPTVSARRRATVLTSRGGSITMTDADEPGTAEVRPVGQFLYEPDDAVIRAHLVSVVAAAVNGWLLDPHLAYVASVLLASGPIALA